ncbi:O-antigen polymerase [Candidatus Magnetobacterium bavaricum]|uniref:O-antigen polymerase n=1 Tax=Candidatus Magnetobacterium bavaricum TaxID=29290 RepID=A0A0F3H3C3_9BACT|nr:O-antigen polymerase [Candidatus Magnetobacterium bavaricum]
MTKPTQLSLRYLPLSSLTLFYVIALTFLAFNVSFKIYTLFYGGFYTWSLQNKIVLVFRLGYVLWIMACLYVIRFHEKIKYLLFVFAFSFVFFGFPPYYIQNQVFDYILALLTLSMFIISMKPGMRNKINRHLMFFVLCFFCLSASSLLMLPLGHIAELAGSFSFESFMLQIFGALPHNYLFCLLEINRFALIVLFTIILSVVSGSGENYKYIFLGLFTGSLFAAIMGLLEYGGIVSLVLVKRDTLFPGIFTSFFLNRGWYSQFVTIVVPYILLGFFSKNRTTAKIVVLFIFLIIFEISLILAEARAGWVTYPLVLFLCWMFFYCFKGDAYRKIRIGVMIKVALSVPITIILSLLLIFYVIIPTNTATKSGSDNAAKAAILKQASRIVTPDSRADIWRQSITIIKEKPIMGMGFETFAFYGKIFSDIPQSPFKQKHGTSTEDTPHNMYLELLVNNGVIGLILWILIVAYTLLILIVDLSKNRNLLNAPVIVSIICFHIYNVFQEFASLPVVWILVFINISYTMTIQNAVLSSHLRKMWANILKISVIIVVLSSIHYISNTSLKFLKHKYNYTMPKDNTYSGFYDYTDRRWFSKEGSIYLSGKGIVEFSFFCDHPDVHKKPVTLYIYVDNTLVDEITFLTAGTKNWTYPIDGQNRHHFKFIVSRTYNPFIYGIQTDNRIMGIAVSSAMQIKKRE